MKDFYLKVFYDKISKMKKDLL